MTTPVRRLVVPTVAASVALLAGCTGGDEVAPTTAPASSERASQAPTTDATIQSLLDEAAAAQVDAHALGSLLAEIRIDGRSWRRPRWATPSRVSRSRSTGGPAMERSRSRT